MKLKLLLYSFVFLSGFIFSKVQFPEKDILSVNEAFTVRSKFLETKVYVSWDIKPGYYLYKKSILIKADGKVLEHNYISQNQSTIYDEFFGESSVFRGFLEIDADLLQFSHTKKKDIQIIYQGCAEDKYCYPKVIKRL
tara:strand:+ start:921 stop:1334 length:414 start_codon:yes stop_codon:yes gene_type:complete